MSEMMRGLCLNEDRKLELREFPIPEPKKGYVRVKVERGGICATDIGYWKFGSERLGELPVIIGHEGCGTVDKLGEGVTDVKEGDRVIVMTTYEVCGKCKYCREEATNICINRVGIGSKKNGVFAEYVEIPQTSCIKMPDNVSFDEGALVEVLACGVHATREMTTVHMDDVVLVSGPGPIGTLAAMSAKAAGATVILAGLAQDAPRLKIAKEQLGIDYCVDQTKEDLKKLVMDLTDGYGADVCVECAGVYPSFNTCLDLVRKKGTISQMGVFHAPAKELDLYPVLQKEVRIHGSLSQKPTAWHIALDLIAKGKVDVKPLVSDVLKLEQWEEGFEKASNVTGFKVLFAPQDK